MNELMVVLQDNTYMYYETSESTAVNALFDFHLTCKNNGINTDNIVITRCCLRNSAQKEIDSYIVN